MSGVAAAAYGAALAGAGLLLAAAHSARVREQIALRLAPAPTAERSVVLRRLGASAVREQSAAVMAVAAGAVLGFRHTGPAGMVIGAAGALVAVRLLRSRRVARERMKAEEQLRDVVGAMAQATRAGLSVRRALEEASREAEPPLAGALRATLARLALGEPLHQAVGELSRRIPVPEAGLFVGLLQVHGRTGGDLSPLLDDVAEVVSRRLDARRRIRALSAQGRASGAVLAALPVAFVGLLSGTGGSGLGAFYRTPLGAVLLGGGFLLNLLGFLWIRRIVGERP